MATPSPSGPRLAAPPEILADDPPVTSVMTRDIVAIDAEALLPTARHVMATTGVRHLPVVDRGRCLGVLVEADLVRALAQDPRPFGAGVAATLRQWYRPAPELPPTARVSDAARHMSVDVSDAVFITDRGRLLGIVTATDLVRQLARHHPFVADEPVAANGVDVQPVGRKSQR
jgi:CBS domain-containing protein